ncbi:hypothetical protein [Entomospira culicis]|uniref:Uncharacterized protein n=1 Tax=Entomospira culicis TaxID=2719989 RepID=A0A968GGI1_9SPIO|nr:hypothetical protein [Entomospira culicis]NIZ19922.1 hypothetical protein [Entomospira culicis]NIZ70121.1 hypothetical protein [Entomospira culicis]WDI38048.1 hypothetical protein PVA46_07870 [Entomospira culicis]WDI39671.1 hypothetical protein PVA47_07870 [Entomospira culicis]
MKRILSLLLIVSLTAGSQIWAAKNVALTAEEAIAMLEATSIAQNENESRREAGIKKMAYPALIPVEKGFEKNYERTLINWNWHEILTRVGATAKPNNGSMRDAYLYYLTLRKISNVPVGNTVYRNVGARAFFDLFENVELYKLPLESGKKVNNRFEHFDLYLHELADMDINERQKKAIADIGNNLTGFLVLIYATQISDYENTKKSFSNYKNFDEEVRIVETWANSESFSNTSEHRKLLIEAFGQETYTRWETEHPDLITANRMLGIFAIQLATNVLHSGDKARLDSYKRLFDDLFSNDMPAELFKNEAGAIKNLRAFHKKYLADIAKAEKKAAKGK